MAARLCFHRRLWFCSQGGCVSQYALGKTHPSRADTPTCVIQHALGQTPSPDGHCNGRYASYWNAFLFLWCLSFVLWSFSLSPPLSCNRGLTCCQWSRALSPSFPVLLCRTREWNRNTRHTLWATPWCPQNFPRKSIVNVCPNFTLPVYILLSHNISPPDRQTDRGIESGREGQKEEKEDRPRANLGYPAERGQGYQNIILQFFLRKSAWNL